MICDRDGCQNPIDILDEVTGRGVCLSCYAELLDERDRDREVVADGV